MKKIFTYPLLSFAIALLFLLNTEVSNAQWTLDVMGTVKKQENKKRLEGATITIKRNGILFKTISTTSNGKFDAALTPDAVYLIEFSMPGHVSKKIEISTKNVSEEEGKFGFDFPMELNLFEKMEGLDVSILNKPIAKVAFDPKVGYMDYDADYTKSIQKEVDRLKTELAEKIKQQEEERLAKEKAAALAKKLEEERLAKEKAAAALAKKQEEERLAKEKAAAALAKKQEEERLAKEKADAAALAKKQEEERLAKEKAAALAKKKEEERLAKEKADAAALAKKQEEERLAKEKADAAALAKKQEEERLAKEKADAAALAKKQEEERLAKEKADAAALAKRQEEERLAKEKADAAALAKKQEEERLARERASSSAAAKKQEAERLAKEKADAAALAKRQEEERLAKEKADAAALAKKQEEERLARERASSSAAAKKQEAERLAKEKADAAALAKKQEEERLARERASSSAEAKRQEEERLAKEKADAAALAKKQEEERLAREKAAESEVKKREYFNALVKEGDGEFLAENYQEAIDKFKQALGVFPEEKYPKEKIQEIKNVQASKENAYLAQKEINDKYNKLISEADNAFRAADYTRARVKYNSAQNVKQEEDYPQQQLDRIEDLLAANAKKEIAASNTRLEQKQQQYDGYINRANTEFDGKNYEKAKSTYRLALGIMPNETLPKNKIKEINRVLAEIASKEKMDRESVYAEKRKKADYDKLIYTADRAMMLKQYGMAQDKFNSALTLYPNEKYPSDKLAEITGLLKKKEAASSNVAITNIPSGSRAKITDANEKEIEAKMAALLAKRNKERGRVLQEETDVYKNDEEIRISGGIRRTNDANNELDKYEVDLLALNERGNKYHMENHKTLLSTTTALEKEEKERIYNADKRRGDANRDIIEYAKEDVKYKEEQEALSKDKLKAHHVFVDNLTQSNTEMMERGENMREGNRKAIEILISETKENEIKSKNRSEELKIDVHKYREELEKEEKERIYNADKRRGDANRDIIEYAKEDVKYKEEQEALSKDKLKAHHVFVDNLTQSNTEMMERGENMREGNRKAIEILISETKENEIKSKNRSEELKIDVHKYREELEKEEETRISEAINRVTKNNEELEKIAEDISKQTLEKSDSYKRNIAELTKFKKEVEKLEQQRIIDAEKGRVANKKLKKKIEADILKYTNKRTKDYYKKIRKLDKFTEELKEQDLILQTTSDLRREMSNEDIVKSKETLNNPSESQENRYNEFKEKLDEVRKRNSDFISDLQAIEKEKILLANVEVNNFYKGEKKISENPELAKKYNQGITEETSETDNSITIVRTKVTGNHVDVYERVFYTWGETFFYKNGISITQSLWDTESIER